MANHEHVGSLSNVEMTWSRGTRPVAVASIGNILEWYDFTVYGFVAGHIAKSFFPSTNEAAALLAAFAAFGVGFLARPLGAVLLGRLADKRGRRFVLLLAMFLMAGSSLLIGLLPTFATIGVAAPALMVLARLGQGLSAGAEFGGAAAFLIEWAPERRRGFFSSFHQVGTYGGLLLGVATVAVISTILTTDQMSEWGWRLPFLAGSLLALYALYMRRTVEETPRFQEVEHVPAEPRQGPGSSMMVAAVKCFGIVASWTVTSFAVLVYMTTYTQRMGGLSPQEALWSTLAATAVTVALIPVFGGLSDRLGRKPIFATGAIAFILLPIPFYGIIVSHPGFLPIVGLQIILSVCTAMMAGVGPSMISELFPTGRRATYVGISSALSVTLFGGFAPFISTLLIERTGSSISPAYYVVATSIFTFLTVMTTNETAHRALR